MLLASLGQGLHRLRFIALVLVGCSCCACHAPEVAPPPVSSDLWANSSMEVEDAADGTACLGGWSGEQRTTAAPLAAGDRLVFDLTIDRFGKETQHRLEFEVLGKAEEKEGQRVLTLTMTRGDRTFESESDVYRVAVRLLGKDGEVLDSGDLTLAESIIESHILACEIGAEIQEMFDGFRDSEEAGVVDTTSGPVLDTAMASLRGLVSFLLLVQSDELLSNLLWDVVEKPSLLSLVLSGGIDLGLVPRYGESVLLDQAPFGMDLPGPFYDLPLTISLNDTPALFLELLVTDPSPPWSLTGGIVAFRGRHPTRDISVEAHLVAASSVAGAATESTPSPGDSGAGSVPGRP